jgi:hypothetical protein
MEWFNGQVVPFQEISMSPRLRLIGLSALLFLVMSASAAFAQSQWKEIPVGYNMPKSVMAAAPPSAMSMAMAAPSRRAPKSSSYVEGRDPNHPWEIEFHGGAFFSTNSGTGQPFLLPTGTPFMTDAIVPEPTLQVSSFMFGDGATLANLVAANVGGGPIVPLDPVLARSLGRRDNGPSLGFRLGRDFGRWFNAEMNFDWSSTPVQIPDNLLAQIEATRASFGTFFIMSTKEGAILDVKRSAGSQLFYTGVLNVNLKPEGKVIPYVSFGGGAVTDVGPKPHAGIFGQYSFTPGATLQQGTDLVNLEAGDKNRTHWVAVLGFGVKYYATPRWGLRLDLRDHVTSNSLDTFLSANPFVETVTPGEVASFTTNPSIQFSNDPSLAQSSLSGPAINRIRTFKSNGIDNQLNMSVGVMYRF